MEDSLQQLIAARKRTFMRKGMGFALASGMCYGLYTAFLTLAETQGVWAQWFAGQSWGTGMPALTPFLITFALAALAAGINDLFSGAWSLMVCAKNGQLADLAGTIRSKPGCILMLCAAIGGPFATICYVAALNEATAAGNPGVIVPLAALNCAIGAVLGKIFFKQRLAGHMVFGIALCLFSAAVIGGASLASLGPQALASCILAFLAAFGWGFEGCVAGFGTSLIDYRVGICIRQLTAGVLELLVVYPVLMLVGGELVQLSTMLASAFSSPALVVFALAGLFAMPAFSFWYKGNAMCGAALGMACNGTYAFWGPFFIWLIMGALNIGGLQESYPPLTAVQWTGALLMIAGIFCIAEDPRKAFSKANVRLRPEVRS